MTAKKQEQPPIQAAYLKARSDLWQAEAALRADVVRQDVLYSLTGGQMGAPAPSDPWVSPGTRRLVVTLFGSLVVICGLLGGLWALGVEGAPVEYAVDQAEPVRVSVDRRRSARRGGAR